MQVHSNQLFLASCVALTATAMTFAIRANLIGPIGALFAISPEEMGWVVGTAFWGFTLSMVLGGILCDWLGMRRLLWIAFFSHLLGIGWTLFASDFWSLFLSTLLVGIANGMVEAACNPLVASLFPKQKTSKLNQFHVWFPGGIVLGGLIGYGLDRIHAPWQWQLVSIFVPILGYGALFWGQEFPPTERVAKGVSTRDMACACIRPLFLLIVGCFVLSASTELGTGQWIVELLEHVGVPSILLLVFIYGLMAIGRSFAGEIEERISSLGMLLFSSVFSTLGLLLLGTTHGYWSFLAAALFAIGICFFWPTTIGFVSEYFPKTGPLGMSILGGAGMLSVAFVLPLMGKLYKDQTAAKLPQGTSLADLEKAVPGSPESLLLKTAQLGAGANTLLYVAILPALLSVIYLILYLNRRRISSGQDRIRPECF